MAAEREQPRLVAGHQRLEGMVVPPPDQGDEPLVRLQAQQRRASVEAGDAGGVVGQRLPRRRRALVAALNSRTTAKLRHWQGSERISVRLTVDLMRCTLRGAGHHARRARPDHAIAGRQGAVVDAADRRSRAR